VFPVGEQLVYGERLTSCAKYIGLVLRSVHAELTVDLPSMEKDINLSF
jgi:hypothetical protein